MLNNSNVRQALIELCEKVERILTKRIEQYGYNERAEKNTLKGSELEKSIEVYPTEDGIALQIADYWEYVARGWYHSGKSDKSGLFDALVKWAIRKRIKLDDYSENESAVIVAKKVYAEMIFHNRPIKKRPFMRYYADGDLTKMIPQLKAYMEKWFDNLFYKITEDIDKFFN